MKSEETKQDAILVSTLKSMNIYAYVERIQDTLIKGVQVRAGVIIMKKNEKPLYKELWLWLMLIFFVLLMSLIILMFKFSIFAIFGKESFWVAFGSIGTLLSAIIAAMSIVYSEKIRKQKDTYDAFNKLKQRNFDVEQKIENYDINEIIENYKKQSEKYKIELENISRYLCELEEFSVCVNTNVFSIETVNSMGGPYLIEKFNFLFPLIQVKRELKRRNTIYDQFEKLVRDLEKIN